MPNSEDEKDAMKKLATPDFMKKLLDKFPNSVKPLDTSDKPQDTPIDWHHFLNAQLPNTPNEVKARILDDKDKFINDLLQRCEIATTNIQGTFTTDLGDPPNAPNEIEAKPTHVLNNPLHTAWEPKTLPWETAIKATEAQNHGYMQAFIQIAKTILIEIKALRAKVDTRYFYHFKSTAMLVFDMVPNISESPLNQRVLHIHGAFDLNIDIHDHAAYEVAQDIIFQQTREIMVDKFDLDSEFTEKAVIIVDSINLIGQKQVEK